MTTFILIAMVLLLIAALERTNRRQPTQPPGLLGTYDRNDRDWARTKLDLLALGDQSELEHQAPQRSPRRPIDGPLTISKPPAACTGQRVAGISSD